MRILRKRLNERSEAQIQDIVYEEGVWTPTIQDNSLSDGESQTYNFQAGFYTKIGNRVLFHGFVGINSLGTLATGETANIAGLPFTTSSISNSTSAVVCSGASLNITANQSIMGLTSVNTNHIQLQLWDSNSGVTGLTIAELSAGAAVSFSGQYIV